MNRLIATFATLVILLIASPGFAQNLAAQEKTVPGGTLMLAAYIALWALILGYVVVLSRRQSALDDDIEALKRRIDDLF